MGFEKYDAIKVSGDNQKEFIDTIVLEAPLQISINNEPYTVVMRTPGNDKELIRGLLFAEDIYKNTTKLNIKLLEDTENHFTIYNVLISDHDLGKGYMNKRSLLSVSSCGICGKKSIEDITVKGNSLKNISKINPSKIEEMFEIMKKKQLVFKKTGASHAAAVFDSNYKLLDTKEDIGRHNAVDKTIGELLNRNLLKKSNYLLVSGRVSYEIVTKAFIAKIPTIIAVSGCSSLAIDFSKEFGITLIGFTRGLDLTIYN
ncbi:MAG: formate dehydrogenase family accessory protein FdhD [Lutibacter sp.]|nr:MAG: formate dehydrogenase family accessory protein FdhD [Lutibacter sp.]